MMYYHGILPRVESFKNSLTLIKIQNHSGAAVRRCSSKTLFLKFCKFHKKASVLEPLFDKVPGFQAGNFIRKRLQHNYFCVKFAKFFKMLFYTELLVAGLLLKYFVRISSILALRMLHIAY